MSRRPGIGAGWIDQFGDEVYGGDSVIVNGKEQRPPRYYDCRFEIGDPERMVDVRRSRRSRVD